jgi:hypothetical protein
MLQIKNLKGPTNNELVQVVRDLVLLSMWSMIRLLAHAYEENSVRRGYHGNPKKKKNLKIYLLFKKL